MAHPSVVDFCRTPQEVEFILFFRSLDATDRARLRTLMDASASGRLSNATLRRANTPAKWRALADKIASERPATVTLMREFTAAINEAHGLPAKNCARRRRGAA